MNAARVAVVGGGLSGLTAAHRLSQAGFAVTVLEAAPQTGGRTATSVHAGFRADTGASAIAESYVAYRCLASEVGLSDTAAQNWIGIVRDGRIHLLRMNRMVLSGLTTRHWSLRAKVLALRLLWDVRRAVRRGQLDFRDMRRISPIDDMTARDYALDRLSAEVDTYLCEPIVRAMLLADTDEVSRVDLFAGVANMFGSQLMSVDGGQGMLPQALTERLDDVRCSTSVSRVERVGEQVEVEFDADGRTTVETFDACVVAVPQPVAARICRGRDAELVDGLSATTDYTRCLSVAVGVTAPPRSKAMLVQLPSTEDPDIAVIFQEHLKSPDRAPAGKGLLEVLWSNRGSQACWDEPDEKVIARTLETVFRLFPELRGRVRHTEVTRWEQALPHTAVGGYGAIGQLNADLDRTSRVQFAADYLSVPGQNTAVLYGERAAKNLVRVLQA